MRTLLAAVALAAGLSGPVMAQVPTDLGLPVPVSMGLSATGSSQIDARLIRRKISVFSNVPSGSGAILPSSGAAGVQLTIFNKGSNALLIYPPAGGQIDSLGINAAYSLAAGSSITLNNLDGPGPFSAGQTWTSQAGTAATFNGGTVANPITLPGDPTSGLQASTKQYVDASPRLVPSNNLNDVGSISATRTNLGLGTAATVNTGTSGAVIPLLNAANTWGGAQAHGSNAVTGSNFGISGGTIDGATIGGTTPGSGGFTSLGASGNFSLSGGNSSVIQVTSSNAYLIAKANGTGGISLRNGNGVLFQAQDNGQGTIANFVTMLPSATGGSPVIAVTGDTNMDLHLRANGTGAVRAEKVFSAAHLSGRADFAGGTTYTGAGSGEGISNLYVIGPVSGVINSGVAAINYFAISSDTIASNKPVSGIELDQNWGGTGYDHSRSGVTVNLVQTAAVSPTTSIQQVAGNFWNTVSYNAGGSSWGSPSGAVYGTNPQVILNGTATYWHVANAMGEADIGVVPGNQAITLSGTLTTGDTVTLTFTGSFTGSPVAVSYTVASGNILTNLTNGLNAAIRNNSTLASAGVTSLVTPGVTNVLTAYWPAYNPVTLTYAVSGSATEVVALGTSNSGASTWQKLGMSIIHLGGDGGFGEAGNDIAISIGSQQYPQSGGWDKGINFGDAWPMKPSSTLIGASVTNGLGSSGKSGVNYSPQATYGIKWDVVDFADQGGYSLFLPGFSVAGTGAAQIGNALLSYSSSGLSIDALGYVGSGNAAVASGGGGGSGGATNNYFVGDIVYDSYGGQHKVTGVNSSTGAVTSLTTLVQPFTRGSSPGSGLATTGGSGTGLTISSTWVAATQIRLNPSGGSVVVSLPTSCSGKPTGTLWNNSSVVNVCP